MKPNLISYFAFLLLLSVSPVAASVQSGAGSIKGTQAALEPFKRGIKAGASGRHQDALREFKEALSLDPGFAEAHRMAGVALLSLCRSAEALPHLQQATRLDPQNLNAWINQAAAFGDLGLPEAGLKAFSEASKLDSKQAAIHQNVEKNLRLAAQASDAMSRPDQLLVLDGFLVHPPQGESWRTSRNSTQTRALFLRGTGTCGLHTVFASAEVFPRPGAANSLDDIVNSELERGRRAYTSERYSNLRMNISPENLSGMQCRRISLSVNDNRVPTAPGKSFVMVGWQLYCLHPSTSKSLLLKLDFSQRHPSGAQALPTLDKELEKFQTSARPAN